MSDYFKVGFCEYMVSLVSGRAIHWERCLVIPGWRTDFVYLIEDDGTRTVQYVPSRLLRTAREVWTAGVAGARTALRVVRAVCATLASRSVAGWLLRWLARFLLGSLFGEFVRVNGPAM